MNLQVGVLALQGDVSEHLNAIFKCGAQAIEIRYARQLSGIDGLIIPGGESTTIDKLTAKNNDPVFDAIKQHALNGLPIYGTCMGSIFLAKEIEGSQQGRLAIMSIKVRRNAFGPQRNSFETELEIPQLGPCPFPAIFIRAPIIVACGSNVRVHSRIPEGIVMAEEGNLLVTAFHPEITDDLRVHEYFLSMVKSYRTRFDRQSALALSHSA